MGVQKGQNYEHTQLSPMLVNTMKGHTCNMKRSQKTFEPRANKPNLSHTSRNVIHTMSLGNGRVSRVIGRGS
jgi:S-ribosylhomocysteine lyase LuxS involved in autoinducer biosynthesis